MTVRIATLGERVASRPPSLVLTLSCPDTTGVVAALTLLSIGFYVAEWVRHMNAAEPGF